MHMPTGGLWDWRQQSRGSPTTTPKRASEPLCHSHCLSCAPSKLVFHSFLQGAGTSEELEASCTVQPFLAQGEDRERNCTQISLYPGENIFSKSQQVGRTARTMSRKTLLSSGKCIQHPQQRVKEPFISSVWPGFFFPSHSSSQTPSLSERRCPYTYAHTQLSEVPGHVVMLLQHTEPQDHQSVLRAATLAPREMQTPSSCCRCSCPFLAPTLAAQRITAIG